MIVAAPRSLYPEAQLEFLNGRSSLRPADLYDVYIWISTCIVSVYFKLVIIMTQ